MLIIKKILVPFLVLVIALLLFIIWYGSRMNTPYFPLRKVLWGYMGVQVEGVIIFTDQEKQPKPNTMVQYVNATIKENRCHVIDGMLSDKTYLNISLYDCEIVYMRREDKEASFKYGGCVYTIKNDAATFVCDDGDSGMLGDHIKLFYSKYSWF